MCSEKFFYVEHLPKCETASSDGKTCYNPEVRYGSTIGGRPCQHGNNNILHWCKQLFPAATSGDATYDKNLLLKSNEGALWWSNSGDEVGTYKWNFWWGGLWRNKDFTEPGKLYCNPNSNSIYGCMMNSVTCII